MHKPVFSKRITVQTAWTSLAVFVYFIALCYLSYSKPFSQNPDYFPDEKWRLQLPFFFYEHGTLPTGYEESVRMDQWGFSYANYPLLLTTLVGGILMKIMGLLTSNPDMLVFAARMVSVLAATMLAWFSIKIGEKLFNAPFGWIFGLFVALLPQVMFCGLYFNNDIVALAGSSMILYAWVLGFRERWNIGNVCLLAIGVTVVSLSYYNAYSWILLSFFVYALIWLRDGDEWRLPTGSQRRRLVGLTLLAVCIVACCAGPFFIRNAVLNNGDFLGLATVQEFGNLYGSDGFSPETRMTPQRLGMSLFEMLTTDYYLGAGNSWIESTAKSFIGVFGAMNVFLPRFIYLFVGVFIVAGMVLCVICRIRECRAREYGFESRVMDGAMLLNCAIVAMLALQYSYATDYQAQGRYILPLLLSVAYFVITGWQLLMESVFNQISRREFLAGMFAGMMLCTALTAFNVCYLHV